MHSLLLQTLLAASMAHPAPLASDAPERLIPTRDLPPAALARIREVVPGHTFYRRVKLSHPETRGRLDIFEYLLTHLDKTTTLAHSLNMMNHRAQRLPDGGYYTQTPDGSSGYLWPLKEGDGEGIYFVRGHERARGEVEGRAVAILRYRETAPGVIATELHAFVKVEHVLKRFVLRVFLPFLTGTIDRRFDEALAIPATVAERAAVSPAKVLAAIDAMPDAERESLAELRALIDAPPARP